MARQQTRAYRDKVQFLENGNLRMLAPRHKLFVAIVSHAMLPAGSGSDSLRVPAIHQQCGRGPRPRCQMGVGQN